MGSRLDRVRTLRRATVRQVGAVAVLAAAACGRTDVPAETPETVGSWCDGSAQVEGFRLENGKTVSICETAGSSDLTYTYGALGEDPEPVYSGLLLGTYQGLSGYSYATADPTDSFATEFSGPHVSVNASGDAVATAASGPEPGASSALTAGGVAAASSTPTCSSAADGSMPSAAVTAAT